MGFINVYLNQKTNSEENISNVSICREDQPSDILIYSSCRCIFIYFKKTVEIEIIMLYPIIVSISAKYEYSLVEVQHLLVVVDESFDKVGHELTSRSVRVLTHLNYTMNEIDQEITESFR